MWCAWETATGGPCGTCGQLMCWRHRTISELGVALCTGCLAAQIAAVIPELTADQMASVQDGLMGDIAEFMWNAQTNCHDDLMIDAVALARRIRQLVDHCKLHEHMVIWLVVVKPVSWLARRRQEEDSPPRRIGPIRVHRWGEDPSFTGQTATSWGSARSVSSGSLDV